MANTNDFEVRVATLIAMGGDATNLHTIFEVDKEILRLTQQGGGGGGIPEAPQDGKTYGRKDGAWSEVEGGGTGGYPVKSGVAINEEEIEITNSIGGTLKLHGNNISYSNWDTGDVPVEKPLIDIVKGVKSDTLTTIWTGTQAQYDAIETKSDNVLYVIK